MIISNRRPPRSVPPVYRRPHWMATDPSEPQAAPAESAEPPTTPPAEEFPRVNRLEILDTLESAHGEYFRLLVKTYPTPADTAPAAPAFGPPELCELAIQAQAAAIALGPAAIGRLLHLGFDLLYPFDNPVDQHNWRAHVRDHAIDRTLYAAIAIRVEAEIKRMRLVFKMEGDGAYEALADDTLLVSKQRYLAPPPRGTPPAAIDDPAVPAPSPADAPAALLTDETGAAQPAAAEASPAQDDTLRARHAVDAPAVHALAALEKRTPTYAGTSQVVKVLAQENLVAALPVPEPASGHSTAAFIPAGAFRI